MTDAPAASRIEGVTMAEANRLREAGRLLEALLVYQRVLAADPADDGAYKMRALTLADLGNTRLAREALIRRPDLFAGHERERIEDDAVARDIVWGGTRQDDPAKPLGESERALAALRGLQQYAPRRTRWEATRLRVDALSALNTLGRHRKVADGYQALLDEGVEVPAYILPTVGDSLLALRRPQDAVRVLDAARAHDPDNTTVQILLGYAWLEQERFDLAMPYFEHLAATQPAWPRVEGAKSGYENWSRYSADLNLSLVRAYANDSAGAERGLQVLADVGPHNAGLQTAVGNVQARRQRPEAALQRYDMALSLDPGLRGAREARAGNWLALAQPDRALADNRALRAEYPDDLRLDRLETDIARYRGWQFRIDAGRAKSDPRGDNASVSPLGIRDGTFGFRLESPLLDDRWRVFALGYDDWADFAGERVRYRGLGAGVNYRHDRLGVSAAAVRALDDYDHGAIGLDLQADWRFSDAWSGRLAYRRNDPEASLQARRFGFSADSLSAGANWTPSDYTALDLRVARFRYEDGNRRDLLGADVSQRLVSRPHLIVEGLLGGSTSRGSEGGQTPYFNPSRDASLTAGVRAEHVAWRNYDRALRQRVQVGVGPYWQEDFGTHWVPSVSYRHLWDLGVGSRLEYGIGWSRPVYDGNREQRIAFDIAYRWGTAP